MYDDYYTIEQHQELFKEFFMCIYVDFTHETSQGGK